MKFTATKDEYKTIEAIVDRAILIANKLSLPADPMTITMDLDATHSNGCPLKLAELLAADDSNFAHDVFGISRHIDRKTGKLQDCFLPRFSASQSEPAFTVTSHDGVVKYFSTRTKAVKFIKEHLALWMNPTDRITWGYLNATDLPDHAQIITEYGEPCDACATIL